MNKQINIQEILDWYIWAGVTETCAEKSDILKKDIKENTPNQTNNIIKNEIQSFTPQTMSSVLKNARDICTKAVSLQELEAALKIFEGCNLKKTAASTVFGEGDPNTKIMLIGEAPGADEDRQGRPFVGRCGKLLDKMLAAIGLQRNECYITNILPWRPPGNRTPTDDEVAVCLPFLKRQIELIRPDIILLLGGIALKSVMDCNDTISKTRGKWLQYVLSEDKKIDVLATYHPSYLLRSSAQKAKVWIDLLRVKEKIERKNDNQ